MKPKTLIIISLFVSSVFSIAKFPQNNAEAVGGWIVRSTHAPYRVEQACKDGVQITVVVAEQYAPGGEFGDQGGDRVGLETVYLADRPFSESLLSPSNITFKRDYLAKVAPPRTVHVTATQTVPIDYGADGSYRYETLVIPFHHTAPVGHSALVNNGGEFTEDNFATVEDCQYFNYSANQDHTFDDEIFSAPVIEDLNGDLIQFEIKSVPGSGEVKLNGSTTLTAGSRFSYADLQGGSGELNYTAGNHSVDNQQIVASVHGTMRITSANGDSFEPSITADGLEIAFTSRGNDLSVFNSGGRNQVYKYSFETGSAEPISLRSDQAAFGDNSASQPAISPDGDNIAFYSSSTDLVNVNAFCLRKADTNNTSDVFVWDRFPFSSQSKIERHSMFNFEGGPGCLEPDQSSSRPDISDTRALDAGTVFQTNDQIDATYFDDQNSASDILLNDGFRTENIYKVPTSFVIIAPTPPIILPPSEPQIAPELTPTPTPQVEDAPNGAARNPDISADGNVIAYDSLATDLIKSFLGNDLDTNEYMDVYASTRKGSNWIISRISVTSGGAQATGGASQNASVSQFGNFIAFQSEATNLDDRATAGIAQVYVRDRANGCTNLISVTNDGEVSDYYSYRPSISGNGRFIAFQSDSDNLVEDDTNGNSDIYLVDRDPDGDGSFYEDVSNCTAGPQTVRRISSATDGTQANNSSWDPVISQNGDFVAFTSAASNLVPRDINGNQDVFVHYIGYERTINLAGDPVNIYLPIIISD